VRVDCNWFFMIGSTFLVTLTGWGVTRFIVEPRYGRSAIDRQIEHGGVAAAGRQRLLPEESCGLLVAGGTALLVAIGIALLVAIPGAPLYGMYERAPGRFVPTWTEAVVPILFVGFLVPGIAYGIATGCVRSDRDVAGRMSDTMASMGSYLVLAFFAGQFIRWFEWSNLGRMVAVEGVAALRTFELPPSVLVASIVLLTATINLFMSSASAKWAILAPVAVPLYMGLGLGPDAVQAAYRVGDSITNPITPLNAYLVVILIAIRRYEPKAGLGTLIALLLPYSLTALVVWTLFLVGWTSLGIPLGPR
jgi:aminobenzoyl-glutamate transport protein